MVHQRVIDLCNHEETVTSVLAKNPDKAPYKIPRKLYPQPSAVNRLFTRHEIKKELHHGHGELTKEELDKAAMCGKFTERPSDLFLKIYADVLLCLERDPMAGLVSPPLLASTGTIPLSIVSVIPDIMRHYADVIVRAKYEVVLATNYWQPSRSVTIITDALRELSKRASKMNDGEGRKIVVKLMYDRGTPQQLYDNHAVVHPKDWKAVDLPNEDEIPNLQMEVINFHRPVLGTFHSKYLVVDRKVALLNSNNIQDRPMMIHLEGPIVESFFDMSLLSWHNALRPPLPSLLGPLSVPNPQNAGTSYKFGKQNPYLAEKNIEEAAKRARGELKRQHTQMLEEEERDRERARAGRTAELWDSVRDRFGVNPLERTTSHAFGLWHAVARAREMDLLDAPPTSETGGGRSAAATHDVTANGGADPSHQPHMNGAPAEMQERSHAGENGFAVHDYAKPANGTASHGPSNGDAHPRSSSPEPNMDPTGSSANDSMAPTGASPNDKDNNAEASNVQRDIHPNPRAAKGSKLAEIAAHLNKGNNCEVTATATDMDVEFRPYILHKPHKPFPIAMVSRRPHGAPGHQDIRTPQNAAWLGAFRYAKRKVFIQTPTFNASPVVPAALAACRRGVEVILYLDLGFNDQGEMIPFQGGTNEQVVAKMYKILKGERKGDEKNLQVYWYTGKDQNRPLNAKFKQRNCHVKFCAIDDEVGIVGNGNQDTQSWFHSQEINVMVDSPAVVREWIDGLNANQNTYQYGRVDDDGIWRYREGEKKGQKLETLGVTGAGLITRLKSLAWLAR